MAQTLTHSKTSGVAAVDTMRGMHDQKLVQRVWRAAFAGVYMPVGLHW